MGPIDRRDFIASLGGATAVGLMSHEARADAMEDKLMEPLRLAAAGDPPASPGAPEQFHTVAEIERDITERHYRRGVGRFFVSRKPGGKVERLAKMPAAPTLADFFALRMPNTRNHCLQSANKALQRGADEEVVLACLLHDLVQELICADHGYWGAQMIEPYVSERVTFAIRYHQALRFYPDEKAGYVYPDIYRRLFGTDYVPDPHVEAAYKFARKHRWYDAPREVTVSDLYAFDPKAVVKIDPFVDIIGRHFKQPKEGLGNDNSPVAHMWRSMVNPDAPL